MSMRKDRIKRAMALVKDHGENLAKAMSADFGSRSMHQSMLTDIAATVSAGKHSLKHMDQWAKTERRKVQFPLGLLGAKAELRYEPKGVVGIVSPWNYPLFLTVGPLTDALAAGNRVMIKMATHSQNLCRLLHAKLGAALPEDVVAILPGVAARDFSTLPFDHLLFTGSADAGRTVMRAAAENLTPVTLELGGKSPTIVCDDFDVAEAASRILYAKFVNAGQTCLAPDYLFLPETAREGFVTAARRILPERYPDTKGPSYTSIIDEKSYRRLRATLEDAEAKGATLVPLVPGAFMFLTVFSFNRVGERARNIWDPRETKV